jgi:intracellular sulfur oxidation DsrE/DsrF family protein
MSDRRTFITKLGVLAAAGLAYDAADAEELRASTAPVAGPWDTSWIDQLAAAKYRVVFNGNNLSNGTADYVSTFFDHFHDVHNTRDAETRPVVVFRRLGVSMAFNDAMWEKYQVGADSKVTDPSTKAPARRNIYWGGSANSSTSLEAMQKRGMISLVCNIALGGAGYRLAENNHADVEQVRSELRANLIPGAILVPSGIYALIRAQNAGCAYMEGT